MQLLQLESRPAVSASRSAASSASSSRYSSALSWASLLAALGLQRLVLLGGSRLALEVLELLVDFFAQVVEAVEVLARVA